MVKLVKMNCLFLMNEIEKIANKVGRDKNEILNIVDTYSKDSVSFHEFIEDINKNYSKEEKKDLLRTLVENSICRWKTRCR